MATATPVLEPESLDEPDGLYEVVDGHYQEKEMGAFESGVAMILYDSIKALLATEPLGTATIEVLFLIDRAANTRRRPDVAFISAERWPLGEFPPRQAAWDVVPDLAIEVVSPSNRSRDDLRKLHEYFRAGVRLAWFVYPESTQVYVYESPLAARIVSISESLDGGDVLPGLRLPLAKLFGKSDDEAVPPGVEPPSTEPPAGS